MFDIMRSFSARSRPCRRLLLETLEVRTLLAGDVIIDWNNVVLEAIRTASTPPPIAARNLAIVHTAIYDAVNSIDRTHEPYAVQLFAFPSTSKEAAAAAAAHRALSMLYPAQWATFYAALEAALDDVPDGRAEDQGVILGVEVADQILALRSTDGSGDSITYTIGSDPGDWQPTPPALVQNPLLPQWGNVTPWAMTSGGQFAVNNIPALDSPEYAAAFNEIKSLGSASSTTRTQDQSNIAKFWSNGGGTATPPGHLNIMAQLAAEQMGNSLSENARLFALLNIAQADAAIMSWNMKYSTNFWRPVTGIRNAETDGNPDTIDDDAWSSFITTPPFPTYTSGHSSFSGAAAAVLQAFFATDNISFTLPSEDATVSDRSFTSFSQAAQESADSRLYGGIHWRFDNETGLTTGTALGEFVSANFLQEVAEVPVVEVQDHVLVILGTTQPDVVNVLAVRGGLRVIVNGHRYGPFANVQEIDADLGPGDDRFIAPQNAATYLFVDGGAGDDTLIGKNKGFDVLSGGDGNDRLIGNSGSDELWGGEGDDTLIGGNGRDQLFGMEGDDVINGGNDDDFLFGGEGDDFVIGGGGNDRATGDAGNDVLLGNAGHDLLLGDFGHDALVGGPGRDMLIGGQGADRLKGQGGEDIVIGGASRSQDLTFDLPSILDAWNLDGSFEDRVAQLADALDDFFAIDDGEEDLLVGGGGRDWYLDFAEEDRVIGFSIRLGDRKN